MRSTHRFDGIAALALSLSLVTGAAVAEIETIRLSYAAATEGCPARADFEAELRARTAKAGIGSEGRSFDVVIERGEAGYVGTLAISEQGGGGAERRIDGSDCGEVASALALIAALAIDPEAKTAPRSELEIAPAPGPEPAPPPTAPEPRPPPVRRPTVVQPPSIAAPPESARWGWSLGLGAAALVGPAPKWLFAFGPESELRRERDGWVRSLGLSIVAGQSGTIGPGYDRARFRLVAARASLCPLGAEASLRWRTCAIVDSGALRAEGRDVAFPGEATRLWLAGGLGGRLGYRLGSRFFADAGLIALANIRRDRFVFLNPRQTVHEVPFASFSSGISAGWLTP